MELQNTIDQAIDILRRWELGDTHFSLTTSGSTGEPATIEHSRAALQWSAESTLNTWFTHSNQPEDNTPLAPIQLCILPLNKAGGFMQLIRSAVWNTPIWIGPASANPFYDAKLSKSHQTPSHLKHVLFLNGEVLPYNPELWNQYKPNILSITPMQLQLALKSETGQKILNQMHTVLIGGQAMDLQKTDFGGISKHPLDPYFWLYRNRIPFCRPYTKSQHSRIYPHGRLHPQHQ